MQNVVTIKISPDRNSQCLIHPAKAAAVKLGNKKFARLSYGARQHDVIVRTDPAASPDEFILSQNLIETIHLPDYPVFEIRTRLNEIVIGPHLGLLVCREDRRLTLSKLAKMTISLKDYASIHGSVVVFALDKVDRRRLLIEGYCYNPLHKDWQWGVFPYPAAICRAIGLNPDWKNHFTTIIGDAFFPNRFFGKWDTAQWFSQEPGLSAHIPHTILYHTPQDVFDMLAKFPEVYIKPVLGLQGRGIVRIRVENREFVVKCRENGVNHTTIFGEPSAAEAFLQKRFRHDRYIVQQAIDLLQYKGSLIDFRCILQKNYSGQWECLAIIGRAGVKDSVISNISSGGTAFPAGVILGKVLGKPAENVAALEEEIAAFAIAVGKKLNEYRINFGTLGLDIGVDSHGCLWLIEINNRDPDPGIALDIRDPDLYAKLKAGPLFYAKFLAGFGDKSGNDISGGPI